LIVAHSFFGREELDSLKCAEYNYLEQYAKPPEDPKKRKGSKVPPPDSKEVCLPSGMRGWTVGEGTTAPKVITTPDPLYPESARWERRESSSRFVMRLDETGVPTDAIALQVGNEDFVEASSDALRDWRFAPSERDGTHVPVVMNVQMEFHLSR
jgi:hypothetical protein